MLIALLLAQYDGAGVRVQAGTQHLELFAGFGLLAVGEGNSVTADGPLGFSAAGAARPRPGFAAASPR